MVDEGGGAQVRGWGHTEGRLFHPSPFHERGEGGDRPFEQLLTQLDARFRGPAGGAVGGQRRGGVAEHQVRGAIRVV